MTFGRMGRRGGGLAISVPLVNRDGRMALAYANGATKEQVREAEKCLAQ